MPAFIDAPVSTGTGELVVVAIAVGEGLMPPRTELVTGADFAATAFTPTGSPRAAVVFALSCAQAPATSAATAKET